MDKTHLCKHVKYIHDSVHGYISISNFAQQIIDHKYFQRLRKLKQLGNCNYIFPNAIHTRFEHSIGTYCLANELLNNIVLNNDNQILEDYLKLLPELSNHYLTEYNNSKYPLDKYVIELCKIAALCHDIGHGPFSHVFDDEFLPKTPYKNHPNASHETRSCLILKLIIKNNSILNNVINDCEIQFMANLINPQTNNIGFIYQIVSNSLNSLDVDKYDYIARDTDTLYNHVNIDCSRLIKHVKIIDNNIVYPEQALYDIYTLFQTRYRLHKQIYKHKGVISVQCIIVQIFLELDPILKISNSIDDMDNFCNLTDEYILESVKILSLPSLNLNYNLTHALNLISMLDQHHLYPFIVSTSSNYKIDMTEFLTQYNLESDSNILIHQSKIGFVGGNKTNPLDEIFVYNTKNISNPKGIKAIKKNKEDITILIPNVYQEYVTMLFYKIKHYNNIT